MCLVFTLCWLEVWAWTTSSFLCLFLSFRDNNCNFRRCRSYVQSFKYLFAEYTFFGDILKYNCITLFSRATMHISVYSGYGLIPRKRECQPWRARPSHLAATQLVLFKAYTKFRAAFFVPKNDRSATSVLLFGNNTCLLLLFFWRMFSVLPRGMVSRSWKCQRLQAWTCIICSPK